MSGSEGAGSRRLRLKAGTIWLTSGAASVWGDTPPPDIVSKTAVLRSPPEPISVSSLTLEALPDAWTDGRASVHSIEQAVAAQRGVVSLPWRLVESAITSAMNSGFIRLIPGGTTWPCQPHEAAAVELGMPEVPKVEGQTKSQGFPEDQTSKPKLKSAFREAVLDSSQLTELVEGMGDVLAAAGGGGIRRRRDHDSRRRSEAGCRARQAWARGRLIKPKPMRGLKSNLSWGALSMPHAEAVASVDGFCMSIEQ